MSLSLKIYTFKKNIQRKGIASCVLLLGTVVITWIEFNTSLSPLIKRFGSYSQDEIKRGFYHWKAKHQNELIEEISIAVSIGKRLDLSPANIVDSKVNIDTKNKWKDELENRVITDNYMDKLIKDSNCSSLLDLVFNKKK